MEKQETIFFVRLLKEAITANKTKNIASVRENNELVERQKTSTVYLFGDKIYLGWMFQAFLSIFFFLFSQQDLSSQSVGAFEYVKLDSIPSKRQLNGLMSAMKDSSTTMKTIVLNRLDKSPWAGVLPDSTTQIIASYIDSNHQAQTIVAIGVLAHQTSLSDTYLQQIIPLLKNKDSQVCHSALKALGRQTSLSDAYLQQIIPLLKNKNSQVRHSAAEALSNQESYSNTYLQQIISLLKNAKSDAHRSALETQENKEAFSDTYLQQIIHLLTKSKTDVNNSALDALERQASLSNVSAPGITPVFDDSYIFVRRSAASVLGRQHSLTDAILQQIIPLLRDPDSEVRNSAVDALKNQQPIANPILLQITPLLNDSDSEVRSSAIDALNSQQPLTNDILQQITSLLNDSDSDVRSSAVDALNSQQPLTDAILGQIIPLLKNSKSDVRQSAASIFVDQHPLSDTILQQIIPLLKNSKIDVRKIAVNILVSQHSLPDAILKEITPLLRGSNEDVRSSAGSILFGQQLLSDAILQQITPLLKNSKSSVRTIALGILGSQHSLSDTILQQIAPLLKDSNSSVRAYAAGALGLQYSLSDIYLQQIIPLLMDSDSNVRAFAAGALGSQHSLPDAILHEITPLLKDSFIYVRRSAVTALVNQHSLSNVYIQQIIALLEDSSSDMRRYVTETLRGQHTLSAAFLQQITPLLKDLDHDVRSSAASILGSQEHLSDVILQQIIPLLKDSNNTVRNQAWQNLYQATTQIWYQAFPVVASQALLKDDDRFREDSYQSRVPLFEVSGGEDTIVYLLKWLCRPNSYPAETSIKEAQKTLDLILGLEQAMDTLPLFKIEVGQALPEMIKSAEKKWRVKDISRLKRGLSIIHEANPTKADYVQEVILSIESRNWLYKLTLAIGVHLIFWLLLLLIYPFSALVQAMFLWNPKVRKWLGLGYVSFLITWIPFLRQRLFAPFREILLGEAFPTNWQKAEYFPDSEVYSAKDKKRLPVAQALYPLRGQILLQGESGLGKTMYLRNVASSSNRIIAYLPASKCTNGLIPAIQQKVHGAAADPRFLQQLIYAGAIDILIDGLNEISARACIQLSSEIERYFKGNLLLTSQPMEWEPPSSAKLYELKPLSQEQIEAFLLSRYPYLEQGDLIPESAYQEHCKAYLQEAFRSELDKESLKSNQHILSNPMDLALVAQLIARGEKPSLLDLQQQQYELMSASYKFKNLGNEFPLKQFSEVVYKMRINDQPEIPHKEFAQEMKAMERWKMVISRQSQVEGQEKPVKQWYFRHDKIMDYFLTQEFLSNSKLPDKHIDDPRFRGVYFLLAYKLEYDDAMLLRERLIQHAVETKDHTLSDTFIQLIRRREKPKRNNKDELRMQVLKAVGTGESANAIEILKDFAIGEQEEMVTVIAGRLKSLKNAIVQGVISSENLILERNQINRAIIDLVEEFY